jgi:hypothetical protein
MTAAFVDLWSGVSGKTRRNFGDGTAALGAKVRHTYRRRGRYTVRITSRDGRGNVRTLTLRIRVRG